MARVVVSLRIMPQSPDVDLSELETKAKKEIVAFCSSEEFRTEIQPIAFGLKALMILFVMEESIGTTEKLEQKISQLEGVESVEVTDVRRAVG
ncbi:MAG TPA: elongation factor 1-beta [Candidatus Nanoarchaeia archaeon]|nr:elongation factor 1-beta [Candidatus Nanoarchaeia archaeon]